MAAPDGTVFIDTRIDTKTFNRGVKGLSDSFGGVLGSIKKIGKALSTAFLGGSNIFAIIKNLAKFAAAAFIGGSIINSIRGLADSFDLMSSSVGEKIKPLSDALETLKGTFVNLIVQAFIPMIPYIIMIVQWLTNMLQIVTQVIAALFGFDKTVGSIMTKAAAGAKKAAKEAKGALAAFDQINVLQQKQEPEEGPTGPTATPGPLTISPEAQRIADSILEKIAQIKKFLADLFHDPVGTLKILWESFVGWFKTNIIDPIAKWWGGLFSKENLTKIGNMIFAAFVFIGTIINTAFTAIGTGINTMFVTIGNIINAAFILIGNIINGLFTAIGNAIQSILGPLLSSLAEKFNAAREGIVLAWGKLSEWFMTNVFQPIANGFGSALTTIKQGFMTTFIGIKDFVKGVINNIIDFINRMINGVVFGINAVIGAANAVSELVGLPEIQSVTAPKIPKLATGAVIPPNAQFAAILGDQRSGRNIEAPEALIRQIVREETGKMQAEIQISFTGSLSELVRQLKPHIDRENVRVGGSLIKSGVTV